MFLYYMEVLQSKAPDAEYQAAMPKLVGQFMMGVMDPELLNAAETSVPPGDIQNVGSFRTAAAAKGVFLNIPVSCCN